MVCVREKEREKEPNQNGSSVKNIQLATSAISNAGFVQNPKAIVYLQGRQNFLAN
jgi:hypothetical protein